MAPRRTSGKTPAPDSNTAAASVQHPPFWIADRVLPVGSEMGAGLPARAFSPGDRVPDEHVTRFGWQEFVSPPDGDWPAPEVPEPPEPTSAAATPGSQPAVTVPGGAGPGQE